MTPHEGPLAAADCLVPDWPVPEGVFALCTTRTGGVSLPPYDSLNLGTHVGDDLAAVHTNRMRLQSTVAAAANGTRAVFLNQVHGDGVVHLDSSTPDGIDADASVATALGVACTIMVADCLPVLLAHRSGRVVAAAHAGWRGLAGVGGQGVLESVFKRFEALALDGKALNAIKLEANDPAQTFAQDTLVWLGPCIGPQAFEVGAEVRAAFCEANPASEACFVPSGSAKGKYLCDLAGLARLRLQALGITHIHGNDGTSPWCTVTNASRFFSHRRDSGALGASGRFAACIWRS
ncbi:peptidoglycan editing factor PgeF [Acidovorax sp.]|uniref:peptidoglycan editing factor PgeF n=1 Tax=Acidovorax sp. TaxID=1872122 RepID=UPI0027B8AE40|nr:peptidoglycan editing factor PgeF [Acidovorax sp.]